jgi:hypothetical protein
LFHVLKQDPFFVKRKPLNRSEKFHGRQYNVITTFKGDERVSFKSYNKIILCDDTVKNLVVDGRTLGYEFRIKYPSYRGTYLSCVEELNFELDGVPVPRNSVYFLLNNKQFLLDELPELFKEYWFVVEPATIRVMLPGGIAPGEHTVRVLMRHRVPYTGYFGQYLVLNADVSRVCKTV